MVDWVWCFCICLRASFVILPRVSYNNVEFILELTVCCLLTWACRLRHESCEALRLFPFFVCFLVNGWLWDALLQMCKVGGHISLCITSQPHTQTCVYVIGHMTEREQNDENILLCTSQASHCVCVCVCEPLRRWVIQHMRVIATPRLSSPTASPGWKRVKPQTSGAPQPIRTVYLASRGSLAEHERTARRAGLRRSLCSLSFSTALKLFWLSCLSEPSILQLGLLPQSDRTL